MVKVLFGGPGAHCSEPRGDPAASYPALSFAAHTLLAGTLVSNSTDLHFPEDNQSQATALFLSPKPKEIKRTWSCLQKQNKTHGS